jgi:hypothetical protein
MYGVNDNDRCHQCNDEEGMVLEGKRQQRNTNNSGSQTTKK